MEIKFSNLDFAYNLLSHTKKNGSEYQEEETEEECPINAGGFNFPPVTLPDPLNKGILVFRKNDTFYSSHFCLESTKTSVFRGLSKTLYEKLGEIWSPMNENGCGYILNSEKKPEISIVSLGKGKDRLVCLGSFGAIPKKFETLEDFIPDLKTLEKYTNIVIKACLLPLIESEKIPQLPEHLIYVSS